jgi:hypothetical protein
MNPIEELAQKEGEFEINAFFDAGAGFRRAECGQPSPQRLQRRVYQRLTIIRKDCESA